MCPVNNSVLCFFQKEYIFDKIFGMRFPDYLEIIRLSPEIIRDVNRGNTMTG